MDETSNKTDLSDHIKIIKHSATALSLRITNFLDDQKQHVHALDERLAAYGRNLNDEVERLQNRQDYTKYRNDGLLSLIDDCNEKLTSLRDLANVYGSCSTDMRNLTTPKRAIDTISHYEQTAKHQRIAIEPNEIATPDQSVYSENRMEAGACFICPFCMLKLHDDTQKTVSSYDIVNHLKCHSGKSFQCCTCNEFFASKTNMVNHILIEHPENKIKYYHNRTTELEKVTVQLKCNICEMALKTIFSCMKHYENNHPGKLIEFNAIPWIEQTSFDMKTNWLIADFSWNVRQQSHCGKCDHSDTSINKLLSHHNEIHSSDRFEMKFNDKLMATIGYKYSNSNLIYRCVHCEKSPETVNNYESVQNVHDHWLAKHVRAPDFKPFRFHIVALIACYYCNIISSFDGLKEHQVKKHPNEPLVFVKITDCHQCGVCDYNGNGMIKHFADEHKLIKRANTFNPSRFTGEQLTELRAINIHKKIKCGFCGDAFDSNIEVRSHYLQDHPNEKGQIHCYFNDQSVCIASNCCGTEFECDEFIAHFSTHKLSFRCSECDIITSKLTKIIMHDSQKHGNQGKDRIAALAKSLKKIYLEANFIFGNGLVANGYNLLGSEFDYMKRIDQFVEDFKNEDDQ